MSITNIKFEGIDKSDAPDYSNAFIASADKDGKPMNDSELEKLNDDGQFVYDNLIKKLN